MKKTLIALAVLGACTGAAHAQTNVTIYGLVDTGLIKESGSDVRMGGNEDSRIGFKGTEDLGSGLKATFQLERRFNLNNGTRIAGNNALDKLQGADNGEDGVDSQATHGAHSGSAASTTSPSKTSVHSTRSSITVSAHPSAHTTCCTPKNSPTPSAMTVPHGQASAST